MSCKVANSYLHMPSCTLWLPLRSLVQHVFCWYFRWQAVYRGTWHEKEVHSPTYQYMEESAIKKNIKKIIFIAFRRRTVTNRMRQFLVDLVASKRRLISKLVFWAQSTTKDFIRAEGDFHKVIYNWKGQYGRDRTGRTEWENGELSGELMEWNKVERAIKTETDKSTEQKGVGKLGWFLS